MVVAGVVCRTEPVSEQGAQGRETSSCYAEAGFDVGPDGDFDGCVCRVVSLTKYQQVGMSGYGGSVQRKSGSRNVFTNGIRTMTAEEAL